MKKYVFTLIFFAFSVTCFAQSADEVAIKKVIDGETVAHYAADYKTQMSYWDKVPYASILFGGGLFVGDALWKKYDEIYTMWKGQKVNLTYSEWNIRINGEAAFVTFLLQRENLESKVITNAFQERYLEKTNDGWKIVHVTNLVKK